MIMHFQGGELMYAELSFPRGHYGAVPGGQAVPYVAGGTLPRRKPDPTIYAQIDHAGTQQGEVTDPGRESQKS